MKGEEIIRKLYTIAYTQIGGMMTECVVEGGE